ncbi:hypothetical protein F5884DRAFT_891272 [Xylogone sp. PMI_703]|nr:hypothetical protein F5884DRAFT_891272 [Xylogone sp. PMI_703]
MSTEPIALRLVVQPSSKSRAGVRLWPPVVGIFNTDMSNTSMRNILSHIIAVATVIDERSGRAYPTRERSYNDSPHLLGEDTFNGISESHQSHQNVVYVHFPYLVINTPGRYIIRVSLAQRMYTPSDGVYEYVNSVDSHTVAVSESSADIPNPTPDEQDWLRVIREDGQHIPEFPA